MDKEARTMVRNLTGSFMEQAEEALAGTGQFSAYNAAVANLVGRTVAVGGADVAVNTVHVAWSVASELVDASPDSTPREAHLQALQALLNLGESYPSRIELTRIYNDRETLLSVDTDNIHLVEAFSDDRFSDAHARVYFLKGIEVSSPPGASNIYNGIVVKETPEQIAAKIGQRKFTI